MTTIIHLITGLNVGGAELALFRLLEGFTETERHSHRVISMIEPGPVGEKITALGVPVASLGMAPGRITPGGLVQLCSMLRATPGWHLQCWMYHANLLGSIACGLLLKPRNLVWSIRNSLGHMEGEKPLTRLVIRLCAWLSCLPQKILYVAQRSAAQHEALGYCKRRRLVIPVGYDVGTFAPGSGKGLRVLARTDAPLIAHVGRWDWSKDHANFLAALAMVPEAHGVLIGKDIDEANADLMALVRLNKLESRVHLLGYRDDVNRLLPGADLLCLSSITEAQPNAVGEAMACGLPCVVTDVGDAGDLVGETGWVVPPQNPEALAGALKTALESDLPARGKAARERILTQYTRHKMLAAYRQLYHDLGWSEG